MLNERTLALQRPIVVAALARYVNLWFLSVFHKLQDQVIKQPVLWYPTLAGGVPQDFS
jgi:hypothetical protein